MAVYPLLFVQPQSSARPPVRRRRSSRRLLRRREFIRGAARIVALLLISCAFAGGYIWQHGKTKRLAEEVKPLISSEQQRREALRLVDEAVRARHEKRWQGAINALTEARRADPLVLGVDVLLGEIALEQKDAKTMRYAAEQSLRRGESESAAKLLLALVTWMGRGEDGAAKAGNLAKQQLAEAMASEPSNAAAYFFHGELNRLLGESGEAHNNLLAALRRQVPWKSSALLAVKSHLAAHEALKAGQSLAPLSPNAQAAVALAVRGALESRTSVGPMFAEMLSGMPSLQAIVLLEDPTFNHGRGNREVDALLEKLRNLVAEGVNGGLPL